MMQTRKWLTFVGFLSACSTVVHREVEPADASNGVGPEASYTQGSDFAIEAGPTLSCATGSDGSLGGCISAPVVSGDSCASGVAAPACDSACGTYDEAIAALRLGDACAQPDWQAETGGWAMVQLGVCGAYRVIDLQGWGLGSERIRFYDEAGTLVAEQQWSDTTQFCAGTAITINHGPVPHCRVSVCETICQGAGHICTH